jgi:hypothetical protein
MSQLGKSASAPSLNKPGSSSLRAAGMTMGGLEATTTNLYDKMKQEGRFRDYVPHIPPAGRSTVVPLNDSAAMDVQSEIYYAAPLTPIAERRFRRSNIPGEIHVHHSLKDQKLPGEEFRYGIRGVKGSSTEQCLKAGQKFGIEAYQESVKERIYESNKKEPFAKPHVRGHVLKMLPEGFGNPSGVPEDCKKVVFPVDQQPNTEEHRLQYIRSHKSFAPGERVARKYNWPDEANGDYFRFGKSSDSLPEGVGARLALNCMVEDDGHFKKTKLVQKVAEDYRHVVHPKFASKLHYMQGATGPPMEPDWAYGIKSISSDCTARSCILGYYSLDEQLPDQDLGRCTKVGRRNVTREQRAFGVPSVRTDLPAPPGRRSVADMTNYGDECGTAALMNPQRFDDRGVPDREFLLRRPKDELRPLVDACRSMDEASMDFDEIWEKAVDLFDDGIELVSLDAFLYIYTQKIEERVHKTHGGLGGEKALTA